jgi:hypothetical protein
MWWVPFVFGAGFTTGGFLSWIVAYQYGLLVGKHRQWQKTRDPEIEPEFIRRAREIRERTDAPVAPVVAVESGDAA